MTGRTQQGCSQDGRANESRYAIGTPGMPNGIRGTEGVIEAPSARCGLFLAESEVAVPAANSPESCENSKARRQQQRDRPLCRPPPVWRGPQAGCDW